MKKFAGIGPYLYAVALGGFGVIQLVVRHFLSGLLPVPATAPLVGVWMVLTALIFIGAALGMLFRVRTQLAAVVGGALFLIFLLCLHLPVLLTNIYNPNAWAATFEVIMLSSGAFIIAAQLPSEAPFHLRWNRLINRLAVAGHYLIAASLFVFAIQHILYFDYIVSLIPGWLPARAAWACLVIVAYLACGISFVSGRLLALSSLWLGIMFGVWVVILHAPRAIGKWNVEAEWTSLFVAMAVCGAALTVSRRQSANDLAGIIVLPRV